MRSYDYEAVILDGDVYCIRCIPDDVDIESECCPVFADSEWDEYPSCIECGELHDYVTLLPQR